MGLLGAFIFLGGILRSCRPFGGSGGGGGGGRYHHNHYSGYHHANRGAGAIMGLFTGCTLACVSIVALSSAVLAGLRRATGLTIRHKHQMPAVDIKRTELWLQWYDSKLARINEKAHEKIAAAVGRYGPEIHDPAVRGVWESQLRADVLEKINRLRERRNHYYDLLVHAKKMKLLNDQQIKKSKQGAAQSPVDAQRLTHPPLLAAYLLVGEWLFDTILNWARSNPHFCYESTTDSAALPGSVSYDDLLDGASPAAPLLSSVPSSHAALLDSPAQSLVASSNIGPSAYPAPYIASSSLLSSSSSAAAAPLPPLSPPTNATNTTTTTTTSSSILHSAQLPPDSKMPEPSAPALSESQFLRLVHSSRSVPSLRDPPSFAPLSSASASALASTSPRHASHPAVARSSEDSTDVNANDFDPPPYTLIGHDDLANLVPGPASGSAPVSASASSSSSEQKHTAVPNDID
ncbi:hypothetical protein LPJ72_003680 [Coemansia sp. Benny D160-2]|nr:hypothetical protein LPJ72_003680 [Coemansia sp. Benny D160-2]